jgi:hypothetical protein
MARIGSGVATVSAAASAARTTSGHAIAAPVLA